MQFTPDGKTLLTGAFRDMQMVAHVWDLTAAVQKAELKKTGRAGYIGARLSPDGQLALVATSGGASVLDWGGDRIVLLFNCGRQLGEVIFTPDSRHLLSIDRDGVVERWRIDTGRRVAWFRSQYGMTAGPTRLAISRDGKTLVTTARDKATFWDADKAFMPDPAFMPAPAQ